MDNQLEALDELRDYAQPLLGVLERAAQPVLDVLGRAAQPLLDMLGRSSEAGKEWAVRLRILIVSYRTCPPLPLPFRATSATTA